MDLLIPIGISNRHVHLTQHHVELLFGKGHQLHARKHLRQPGQFAAEETVTLLGKQELSARVVGPPRIHTQVEILKEDCAILGITAPEKVSGNLEGTPGLIIKGPKGSVTLPFGVIIAAKHVHLSDAEAEKHTLHHVTAVDVETSSGIVFHRVVLRKGQHHLSEFHIDRDDAKSHSIHPGQTARIIKTYPS